MTELREPIISTQLYLLAKKIHRFLVLIVSLLIILMTATGVYMKYELGNSFLMRRVHNLSSPLFAIVLFVMMTTGIIMYLYPLLRKK